MMNSFRPLRFVAVLAACATIVAAGCQPSQPSRAGTTGGGGRDAGQAPDAVRPAAPDGRAAPPPKVGSILDPCPSRLHDVSGELLRFYTLNRRLPANLAELRKAMIDPTTELVCPESGQPYVYNPVGIITDDKQPRIVLYDPAPGHGGIRWAVTFVEPKEEGGAPHTDLVPLPESAFKLNAPAR